MISAHGFSRLGRLALVACGLGLLGALHGCGGNGDAEIQPAVTPNQLVTAPAEQTPKENPTQEKPPTEQAQEPPLVVDPPAVPPLACSAGRWCVGAAKESIAASAKHIKGITEVDYPQSRVQGMGVGGYGDFVNLINPNQFNISFGFAKGNYTDKEEDGAAHSLYVRAVYLAIPGQSELALVTVDAIGTGNLIQKGIKQAVSSATGIPVNNVLVGSTHSHSAPDLQGLWGGVPATWLSCTQADEALEGCGTDEAEQWTAGLYQRAAQAVKKAKLQSVAANLEVATKQVDLNQTRNDAALPNQTTDKALTVMRAVGVGTSNPIATVVQYAAHPTLLGADHRKLHSDFVLSSLVRVERELGGMAIYYNGPIADASAKTGPLMACTGIKDRDPRDYCRAQQYGRILGDQVVAVVNDRSMRTVVSPILNVQHAQAVLPVTNPLFVGAGLIRAFNRYYNFVETPVDDIPQVTLLRNTLPQVAPTASTEVSRVTLGEPLRGKGFEMVTIPGEARNGMGQLIRALAYGKEDAKTKPLMLLGLTHNSFGYLIPEEEFGGPLPKGPDYEPVYEELVSLGPATAPLLRFQAYFPLFKVPPQAYAPGYLTACQAGPEQDDCLLRVMQFRAPGASDLQSLAQP